jgi:predicted protein tyrosine phosphatase
MSSITVYSKANFLRYCQREHLTDDIIEASPDAYICIHSPISLLGSNATYFNNHPNVLNLFFDDYTLKEFNRAPALIRQSIKLFDHSMSKQLKEFINVNTNAKHWHLHCTAGVSRSGAIAVWLANQLGINPTKLIKKFNLEPNAYVLSILREDV